MDHIVSLEKQARQAVLTKQHLVGVFFDTEKAYDNLAVQDSSNH
jgi:hypothetical protein